MSGCSVKGVMSIIRSGTAVFYCLRRLLSMGVLIFGVINIGFLSDYKEDVCSFIEHDPATNNPFEVVLLYPGIKALRSHRNTNHNHHLPVSP